MEPSKEARTDLKALDAAAMLHIVFDGPPGPTAGHFVEVETPDGHSINAGEWHERTDGYWELRIARTGKLAPVDGNAVGTRIQNYLNSLDTEGLTAEQVRSIIYAECMDKGQGGIKESAYRSKNATLTNRGEHEDDVIEAIARAEMTVTITPGRRFINEKGQTVFSKVREGTMEDLPADEADCFLCHGFTIIEATAIRAAGEPNTPEYDHADHND